MKGLALVRGGVLHAFIAVGSEFAAGSCYTPSAGFQTDFSGGIAFLSESSDVQTAGMQGRVMTPWNGGIRKLQSHQDLKRPLLEE
jgi:hypothetical protein